LKEALESALAQTYSNIEIIVSDNCSTDNTEEVVKGYRDSRITYYKQETPLITNDNFNFCLSQANGAYYLLLHDDDKIDSDFIDSCLQAANHRTDVGIIRTGVRIINAKGVVLGERRNAASGLTTGEFFLGWFEGKTSLYLCNTLYHTQALKDIGGMKSRHNLFQDVFATARLVASMGHVDIEEVKASTREHGAKWTHVVRVSEWAEDSIDLLDLLCKLAPENANELRMRGEQFFVNINFSRASAIRNPLRRLAAYIKVYKLFNRRYLPSMRMIFRSTVIYRFLRQVKRRILGLPAWVD